MTERQKEDSEFILGCILMPVFIIGGILTLYYFIEFMFYLFG